MANTDTDKTRFSSEVIDLLEALAPSDDEVIAELCGTNSQNSNGTAPEEHGHH